MVPSLPYEILHRIAINFKGSNILKYALVCKQWKEPFLHVLWYSQRVDKSSVNNICDKSYQGYIYLRNAHRIRELRMEDPELDDVNYISAIQQIYYNINRLDYLETYQKGRLYQLIDWNRWTSLSHLKMRLFRRTSIVLKDFFTSLTVLTSLTTLSLKANVVKSSDKIRLTVSWLDIESLHLNLPLLTDLEVDYTLEPISDDELDKIRCLTPAKSVKAISYNHKYIDALWVLYFALKYPDISKLAFTPSSLRKQLNTTAYDQKRHLDDIKLLSTLDQFFPHLKTITTPIASHNGWPMSIFYDTLQKSGINTKRLEVYINASHLNSQDGFNACLKPISESLEILWQTASYSTSGKNFTDEFALYPNLVELYMGIDWQMDIDIILDNCPILRSLYLRKFCINQSKKTQQSSNHSRNHGQHPLQKLQMTSTKISIDAFKYLFIRCKKLSLVKLDEVGFTESNFEETGQVLLDMWSFQLDTLILYNIKIGADVIKYYVIEQLDTTPASGTATDGRELDTDCQEQPIRSNWYHVCLDENNSKRIVSWELGVPDIEYFQEYYRDFKRRKMEDEKTEEKGDKFNNYVPKRSWKKNLGEGSLVFRMRSINSYFLYDKKYRVFKRISFD